MALLSLPTRKSIPSFIRLAPIRMFVLLTLVCSMLIVNQASASAQLQIDGYDPVSYFTGSPAKGSASITVEHKGKVYAFVSKASADKFRKNPAKYVPQFGGNCAFGMVFGQRSRVDPKVWKIVNGKLYMHINSATQRRWLKKQQPYIQKAESVWSRLGGS